MKRLMVALMLLAAMLLAGALVAPNGVEADNVLPPRAALLGCADVNGDGRVNIADIGYEVRKFGTAYPQASYHPLYDVGAGDGTVNIIDIGEMVRDFGDICPPLETQIAVATLAVMDPSFSHVLCDPSGEAPVNCGGSAPFLTEDPLFLETKGYFRASLDVPGQGSHYVNYNYWDGVFNPARPEGLVYKKGPEDLYRKNPNYPNPFDSCADGIDNGGDGRTDAADPECVSRLVAQLYYAEGDVVGWGPDPNSNIRAVNTDALPCTPGCGWTGSFDGWHWHSDLCTYNIGTSAATNTFTASAAACDDAAPGSQPECAPPWTTHPCWTWSDQVGWMGHLWNGLLNSAFTNAVDPEALGLCDAPYCAATESNGRFADCFPDTLGWNAYNCPQ